MKSKIIASICAGLLLAGCSALPSNEVTEEIENKVSQELSLPTQIEQALQNNSAIEEINNPDLTFPSDINAGQVEKYFKIDNILLALALRNSMNVVLSLPDGFNPTFAGVLVAKQGDTQWAKLVEIKDPEATDKNNPYYLITDNQKLLLTIVDQNGAGSGEGIMKVFALTEAGNWNLENCYYFGGSYSDPSVDGDYFAFSAEFSKQEALPIESCDNVQLLLSE